MPYARFQGDHIVEGVVFDLLTAVGEALKRPVRQVVLPRKRLDDAVLAGEIDLRCYINPQWTAVSDNMVWSEVLFKSSDVLVGAEKTPPPPDLYHLSSRAMVSTVLGFQYPALEPLFATGLLRRDDAADQMTALTKLGAGREVYGVSDALMLDWYMRNNPEPHLAAWRLPISTAEVHCAVPKSGAVPARILLQALHAIKQSGRMESILKAYR